MEHFKKLNSIDVNNKVEKKKDNLGNELNYLSWAWAWAETKKAYPTAKYEIKKFNNLPYVFDEMTGYMVYTEVTIEDVTHEMWLPVMNNNNKAMKNKPYEYTTKWGKKTVEAATMFDINKSIMRCLTKNLAMFGLGLYIYAGEDLPEAEEETPAPKETKAAPKEIKKENKQIEKEEEKIAEKKIAEIENLATKVNLDAVKVKDWISKKFSKKELKELTVLEAEILKKALEALKK